MDVNWQLVGIVQQILRISSLMDTIRFVHIPCEWNKVLDCLAKWASEHLDGGNSEDWESLSPELCFDLERILEEDKKAHINI